MYAIRSYYGEILPANSSVQKDMSCSWQNPHLWTLYDPFLYHLQTVLYSEEGLPFDKNTQRFGFREISINKHPGRQKYFQIISFYIKLGLNVMLKKMSRIDRDIRG